MITAIMQRAALLCGSVLAFQAAATPVPYATDPNFNDGLYLTDGFAASGSVVGQKVVALGNGDVLVAAMVPAVHFNTGNNSLGLAMYDKSGFPLTFSNPGLYGWQAGEYVVLDEDPMWQVPLVVRAIKDLQVYGGIIYVLADVYENNEYATDLIEFGTDGHFLFRTVLLGTTSTPPSGGGLAIYRTITPVVTTYVAIALTETNNGYEQPVFDLASIDPSTGVASQALQSFGRPNPGNDCPSTVNCEVTGIAMGRQTSLSQAPPFFLGGARQASTGDWDFLVMSVDASGTPITSFGTSGGVIIPLNILGSNDERATAIVADTTVGDAQSGLIYIVGNVAQSCATGIGVAALYNTGATYSAFGPYAPGRVLIGGSDASISTCTSTIEHEDLAYSATLVHGALAIAGSTTYRKTASLCFISPCAELNVDGELAVLDPLTGSTLSFASYPYTDYVGGPRSRHSELFGLTATENGTFTASGDARYFQSAPGAAPGLQQAATIRFRVADTIFTNGFEP